MPQNDDDLPAAPQCLFCGQRRDGQRYLLWGMTHVSSVVTTPFYADVTKITSEYRGVKRVSYHACRPCAGWAVRWCYAPSVISFVVVAIAFLVAAVVIPKEEGDAKIGMVCVAGLAGLPAVGFVAMWLLTDTASEANEGAVRDRATRFLKAKGQGDTYFTQQEYDDMYVKDPVNGSEGVRAESAAELLKGHDEDVNQNLRRSK